MSRGGGATRGVQGQLGKHGPECSRSPLGTAGCEHRRGHWTSGSEPQQGRGGLFGPQGPLRVKACRQEWLGVTRTQVGVAVKSLGRV